jgi:teichuronic acid biosynthesis glycosyltransferase TuaC
VLASRHESFGVVLVEALMSGKPVLATRCGGPQSIVDDSNGVLVAPGDVDALVGGLQTLSQRLPAFTPETMRAAAVARYGRAAVGALWAALFERVVPS